MISEDSYENFRKTGIVYGKRPFVLVNDTGFYFENQTDELENTIKYPEYEYLLKNIQELIKSDKIIFLYETQEKELKLLKTYLPVFKPHIHIGAIVEHFEPQLKYTLMTDFLKLAKKEKRYFWLSCLVFQHLHTEFNWNPSYFYTCVPIENMWNTLDLSKITLPEIRNYLDNNEFFDPIIFLELIVPILTGEPTHENIAIKMLMKEKEIKESELNVSEKFLETLMKAGVIYRPRKGYVKII